MEAGLRGHYALHHRKLKNNSALPSSLCVPAAVSQCCPFLAMAQEDNDATNKTDRKPSKDTTEWYVSRHYKWQWTRIKTLSS